MEDLLKKRQDKWQKKKDLLQQRLSNMKRGKDLKKKKPGIQPLIRNNPNTKILRSKTICDNNFVSFSCLYCSHSYKTRSGFQRNMPKHLQKNHQNKQDYRLQQQPQHQLAQKSGPPPLLPSGPPPLQPSGPPQLQRIKNKSDK